MKKYLMILLLAPVIISFTFCSSSNELNLNKKITSVIIMPLMNNNGVYFRDDQIWHKLVWSFKSNGFNVVNNDSVWNTLVNYGYDLSRLTDTQAMEISKTLNVDLIVFRGINYSVLKVFDSNKKEFVVYDDMRGLSAFDIRLNKGDLPNYSLNNKYAQLVMKVRGLGY
jgi:hypothetical protein